MPFMGLIGANGHEIIGDGYHRIDMSETRFKISPPNNPKVHYVFINVDAIYFPAAKNPWPEISGCCVYAEIDDERPIIVRSFPGTPKRLNVGGILSMGPGQLTMEMTVRSNNETELKCPKCGALI